LGFPKTRTISLPYSDQGSFVNVSGLRRDYTFRLNSIFDPDFSGVGHQPLAHDQWQLFYNHYVVTRCSWEVELAPQNGNLLAGFYVSDDSAIPTATAATLIELGAQAGFVTPELPLKLSGEIDVAQWFARPRAGLPLDSQMRSPFGANPAEVVFGTLFMQVPAGTATVNVDYVWTFTFECTLMEPKDLAQS